MMAEKVVRWSLPLANCGINGDALEPDTSPRGALQTAHSPSTAVRRPAALQSATAYPTCLYGTSVPSLSCAMGHGLTALPTFVFTNHHRARSGAARCLRRRAPAVSGCPRKSILACVKHSGALLTWTGVHLSPSGAYDWPVCKRRWDCFLEHSALEYHSTAPAHTAQHAQVDYVQCRLAVHQSVTCAMFQHRQSCSASAKQRAGWASVTTARD